MGKKLCRQPLRVCMCVFACSNICKIFTYLPKPIKRPPGNQHTNNNNNIQRQDSTFFFSIQLNSHLKTIVIDKHFTSFWTSFYVRVTFVYSDEECRHTHWIGRVPVFFFCYFSKKVYFSRVVVVVAPYATHATRQHT